MKLCHYCRRCGRKLKTLKAQQRGAGHVCKKKIEQQKREPELPFTKGKPE